MATIGEALTIAYDHLTAGRSAEAEAICGLVLDAAPDQPDALQLMGAIAGRRGRLEDAAACFARSVERRPESAAFRVNFADALRLIGRLEDAAAQYRAALTLAPGMDAAWEGLAAAAAKLGFHVGGGEAGAVWFRLVCVLDPAHPNALYNLAGAARVLGDPHAAALFRRAFRIGGDPGAAYNLGVLAEEAGADRRAAASFSAAVVLSPGNAAAWGRLGSALHRLGAASAAIRAARAAVRLEPKAASVWEFLAGLHLETGQGADAEAALRTALDLVPSRHDLRPVLWRLQRGLGRRTPYFSADGQDAFVHEAWFRDRRGGVFVDVGAFDGILWSNTLFFERALGWSGLCVEASPRVFARLAAARSCACANVAVSDFDGEAEFMDVVSGLEMMGGLVADQAEQQRAFIESESEVRSVTVPVRRLDRVLAQHGIAHVDYCSIDVEGSERRVIDAIDFSRVTIDVFTVENQTADPALRGRMEELGYVFVCRFEGTDELFVRRAFLEEHPDYR